MLSVKLTFVPRQHVLKLNKHGNVNKCPPMNIYFLIAGLENKYLFGKSERPSRLFFLSKKKTWGTNVIIRCEKIFTKTLAHNEIP